MFAKLSNSFTMGYIDQYGQFLTTEMS